jgi:dTDP-4-amino-4,6-dideoxygalactose transaminase
LSASGLVPGDEIILSPLTCKVVPLTLIASNLKPVYADISAHTLNFDPQSLESVITPATRSVLFQHTYGYSNGVKAVAELSAQRNLMLIEDCAQCLPFSSDKHNPGSWGQAAIFSNNLLKPLSAGSGGVAITNDFQFAQKIQEQRDRLPRPYKLTGIKLQLEIWIHDYLLRPRWYWSFYNINRKVSSSYRVRHVDLEIRAEITNKAYRASTFQMREGIRSLSTIESNAAHRHLCCSEYSQALRSCKNLDLPVAVTSQPLYYYPVLTDNKEEILRSARKRHVELIAWPIRTPIYPIENEQDLLAYGYEPGTCRTAEDVAKRLIGLPTHDKITAKDRRRIIDLLIGCNG